jgi:hypothetical protein
MYSYLININVNLYDQFFTLKAIESNDCINQFSLAILAVILNYEQLEAFSVYIHP